MSDYSVSGSGDEGRSVEDELLEAKLEEAVAHLARIRPGGHVAVTAIPPDGGPTKTETFGPGEEAKALQWFEDRTREGMNLYWTVNPTRGRIRSKASKEDIEEQAWLHVDLDGRKGVDLAEAKAAAIEALRSYRDPQGKPCPPTLILDSGGGAQGFWRLDAPLYIGGNIPAAEEAEAYNRQIEADFSGHPLFRADACHNCDRVMRLPGTINRPNKKKRDTGRVPVLASVIEYHEEREYPLGIFEPAPRENVAPAPGQRKVRLEAVPPLLASLDELPAEVTPRIRMLIVQGCDPDEPDRYASRSEATFAVCRGLVEGGCDDETIAAVLLDPGFGISKHTLAQKRSLEYAARQIERARKKAAASVDTFATDKDGKPYANHQGNIRLALKKLDVRVCFDEFAERTLIDGLDGFGPHLGEAAMTRLWLTLAERFGVKAGKEFFWSVVEDAARRDSFHPVVDYLDGLEWDGVKRIDDWLATYMGAESDEYSRHVGALWLIAGVRRVRQPGCKFDEMVIFESEQGKDKSTALAILAVREEWFSDDLPLGADAKVVIERTQGRWIVEAAELDGMGKKDVESLKAMLSRRIDRSRMAWGRMTHEAPRQFVVIGTTNGQQYLRDSTGNRRFWPVRVGNVDTEKLRRDRDQIWAEAAAREAEGASIRLDKGLWKSAAAEQSKRRLLDPYFVALDEALGDQTGKIRTRDVWLLVGVPVDRRTPQHEQRVGEAMRELGFERKQGRFGGGPEYAYVRGTKAERLRQIEVVGDDKTGWTVRREEKDKSAQMALDKADKGDDPY